MLSPILVFISHQLQTWFWKSITNLCEVKMLTHEQEVIRWDLKPMVCMHCVRLSSCCWMFCGGSYSPVWICACRAVAIASFGRVPWNLQAYSSITEAAASHVGFREVCVLFSACVCVLRPAVAHGKVWNLLPFQTNECFPPVQNSAL